MRAALPAVLRRRLGRRDAGYVAVMIAILLPVLLGFCAFAVDVGNWYFTGQRVQRAADAAALAGVPSLPNDPTTAFSVAQAQAGRNDFATAAATTVTPALDGRPTRLRVTINTTVRNQFGWLLGLPSTTITRTAVADYAGPVAMGSPCNEFGNDPEPGSNRGSTCDSAAGDMWANVNGYGADKQNGDSFQSKNCNTGITGRDGCSGSANDEFDENGYFYAVNVLRSGMSSLTIQLYDPVWVNTGLTCEDDTAFGGATPANTAVTAVNEFVDASDAANRYKRGASERVCTGDNKYGGAQVMNTKFTVRDPSGSTWDALSYPEHGMGCTRTFDGYTGDLFSVLNQYSSGTTPNPTYQRNIAEGFRRWVTLCTIPNPQKGDYLVQVQSNLTGFTTANTGNRFSIRAFGTDNDYISISGRERMGIFSNKPDATTEFYLARVPSGAAGQNLTVNLYDVGDSTTPGLIKIVSPSGADYTGCTGSGVTTAVSASNCSFIVAGSPSPFNGRWQSVYIPIPSTYSCDDTQPSECWVKLQYRYGAGSKPTDVTTWTANIQGDPVRLVE